MKNNLYQSKEFAQAWDKYLSEEEDVLRTRMMNTLLLKNIGDLKGKSVLDAGCGNGFFIKPLLTLNPEKICAFDISPHFIDISKKRYSSVIFKIGDINKRIPFGDKEFDCVVCYSVLMDLPKIAKAVQELSRVTKESGDIHISVVHPLYNLFISEVEAQTQPVIERLKKYTVDEEILVKTIPGFNNFIAYRRPIADYVNEFIKNKLLIERMLEVPISKEIAKINEKYKERIGIPVFVYFKLKKSG
jgi:ubiquinone/menaquinone biosynthesis C-methylase UbiE